MDVSGGVPSRVSVALLRLLVVPGAQSACSGYRAWPCHIPSRFLTCPRRSGLCVTGPAGLMQQPQALTAAPSSGLGFVTSGTLSCSLSLEFVFKTELMLEPTLQVPLQGLARTYIVLTTVGGGGEILGLAVHLGETHHSRK